MFIGLVVSCSSTHEVRRFAGPLSSEELETAKARLRLVRSEMPVNRVLDTLRLSRFRGNAKNCEGPTTLALPFDLGADHTLELYYQRANTNSPKWELYWVMVDEAAWYPAQNRRVDAACSGADCRKYGQAISPVTTEELRSARDRLRVLRSDMNVNQVLSTLMLSRFRGYFTVGAGSISFSPYCDLGGGHKLGMIYNWTKPSDPPSAWELSWVGLDWDEKTGDQWAAPKEKRK